ncbi:MAG TPA: amidoligase family protein [Verrucomicrobiae bacterium]|nr:amidoligase family protein [Verrucomicrobiae bacterium]
MTEPIPITELTFGVELEVIMPAESNGDRGRTALADRMVEAGVECAHESYNHRTRPHWKIVTDSSIGHQNAEIVSPILRGEDGFEQIRKVCRALGAHGCRVNHSTGFHVHVGARDRFAEQVGFFKELVRTHAKFEPVIDQLVSQSRRARNSQWCQPTPFNDNVERATTIDRVIAAANPNGRYAKLNLTAYHTHGTVEFRQHQGTTNAQKIENWVKLCLRIVAHAARNTERAGTSGEFVPPVAPLRPPPPRFPDGQRDLSRAPVVGSEEIPRFIRSNYRTLADLVIVYVTERTHRRAGTAGRENHERHNVFARELVGGQTPMDLWQYHRRGGRRTHLAWDVDHGLVRVARRSSAPPFEVTAEERERLTLAWRATVARMEADHTAAVERARRAWEAGRGSTTPTTRPPTDVTPATLEGLLSLVSAVESERAYFTERQMELN